MIVPAILTQKGEEFKKMLELCSKFTNYVQIDIMDGKFVPSSSIQISDLEGLEVKIKSEAHLMVKEPLAWLGTFKKFGSKRIIFHFEIEDAHLKIIKTIKKEGLEAGIAVNPSTEIKDFEFLVQEIDALLFMSVVPGFYGSKFIPEVLSKIKRFKKMYPHKIVGIDGGIKLDNVNLVKKSGVDYICVGSAIFKEKNPKEAYLKFIKALDE